MSMISESGFYYAMARYYDVGRGRFISPDPLGGSAGNPQGHNGYAYVLNNPANLVDPSGQCSESFWGGSCNDFDIVFTWSWGSGRDDDQPRRRREPPPPPPPYHVPPVPHMPYGVGGSGGISNGNSFLQLPPPLTDPQLWDKLLKLGITTYGALSIYLASRNKKAQQSIDSLMEGLESHLKMLDPSYNPDPDNRDMWKRKLKNKIDDARAKLKRLKGKTLEKLKGLIDEAEKKL